MKKIIANILIGFSILLFSCSEEKHEPISNDKVKPGIIKNVTVQNLAGKVVLTYELPNDDDLLYTKAEYQLKNGTNLEVKSSIYSNTLTCEGFGSADEYEIKLYAVDRSNNQGDAVTVKVNPEEPPLFSTFKTIKMLDTFGGVNLQWENETGAALVVEIMIDDTLGTGNDYMPVETIYTESKNGNYNIRGFNTDPVDFYCYVRDRWDNYSDTLKQTIEPLYEVMVDKSKMKAVLLPNDVPMHALWRPNGGSEIPKLWDNSNKNDYDRMCGQNGDFSDNYSFTFDLGTEYKLSRFTLWQFLLRYDEFIYGDANIKSWEMYGCTKDELNMDGSYDNWHLLGEFEIIKPSGLPVGKGSYSDEDKALAFSGHEFNIPINAPNVQYIRMKVTSVWGATSWVSIGEMEFFGQPVINETNKKDE
ncbi:DUF4959 domain-containing protein [Prolixibacteraceae bacterium JC049]|nr:DUF4959 domain-containing protein [Prolixibacteraceae bacterium JC049]